MVYLPPACPVVEDVKRITADILSIPPDEIGKIREEDRLREDLGADSLDLTELIAALFKAFAKEIAQKGNALPEPARLSTIRDFVDYIEVAILNQPGANPDGTGPDVGSMDE